MTPKSCFVICPLGRPVGQVRARSDGLLNFIIRPVLEPLGYRIDRADLALDHPTIPDTISAHIFGDDLVIADLTDSNANVFYELGKRHALNRACVHFSTSVKSLPFDVRHYRVIEYNLEELPLVESACRNLDVAVKSINWNPIPQFPLSADDVIRMSGRTVVVRAASGRDDPYLLSQNILLSSCKLMVLMQRSSSLILGPEQGWGAEEEFYRSIMDRLKEGVELCHVVSLDGIIRHLRRPQSRFPALDSALGNLVDEQGCVAIQGKSKIMYIKQIEDKQYNDVKTDRQARALIVERIDGMHEGNFVIDIGGTQRSFQLRGPEVGLFMSSAVEFYRNECTYLIWNQLNDAVGPYRGQIKK
jgi:hypothetical protein